MPPDGAVGGDGGDGPEVIDRLRPVSRETRARLIRFVELLRQWQRAKNLVGPGTLDSVWRRHVLDSMAPVDVLPQARVWADLGSGAGFPGMVTAILLGGEPGARVHLVEANGRKAAFLRTAARETGAPATVHAGRIDEVVPRLGRVDAVSARALAPLDRLLEFAAPLMEAGAAGVFHKGRELAREVAAARVRWSFDLVEHVSRSDPSGRVAVVTRLARRDGRVKRTGGLE
jgi:16S rRNA (guanine527-N7)-methyltransferase